MANPFTDFTTNFNLGGIFDKILLIGTLIFVIIIVGAIMFFILKWKGKQKLGNLKEIHWWEEINGKLTPIRVDQAEELTIPGTNLKLLHVKKSNTWLPRFTRGISPTVYYVAITAHKEIVNFTLKSLDESMMEAGLDYDHTDMRWAAENLREFVKRNYKDKAVKWWQQYAGVITTAAFILVMTFSFVIILYFMRGVVSDIGVVAKNMAEAANQLNLCTPQGSGVIQK